MYRNQSRFGDPMAAYVKKRQPDEPAPVALPGGKRKKSGAQLSGPSQQKVALRAGIASRALYRDSDCSIGPYCVSGGS